MSVYLVMPSKRAAPERDPVLKLWRDRGYKISLQCDGPTALDENENGDVIFQRTYHGYAEAVNFLVKAVLDVCTDAQWIVCAGDDTEPDLVHSADEIARECENYLGDLYELRCDEGSNLYRSMTEAKAKTFGVMQCTGDRWGEHRNTHAFTPRLGGKPELQVCSQCGRVKDNSIHMVGAYIDRVAGSPWMGREFCLRVNQGRGPLWAGNDDWPGYFHMGCDEELQAVATRLGVFWQRPDLNQLHKHWGRAKPGETTGHQSNMPDFLERANSAEEWNAYKKLFAEREAAGFPGSEPL